MKLDQQSVSSAINYLSALKRPKTLKHRFVYAIEDGCSRRYVIVYVLNNIWLELVAQEANVRQLVCQINVKLSVVY